MPPGLTMQLQFLLNTDTTWNKLVDLAGVKRNTPLPIPNSTAQPPSTLQTLGQFTFKGRVPVDDVTDKVRLWSLFTIDPFMYHLRSLPG